MVLHPRAAGRLARHLRVRKKLSGTAQRPRLCVFRSNKHIQAQLIDDEKAETLASASSRGTSFRQLAAGDESARGGNRAGAALVGKLLAERAKALEIEKVVFDRNGYLYHGRVKALADAAHEGGLKF